MGQMHKNLIYSLIQGHLGPGYTLAVKDSKANTFLMRMLGMNLTEYAQPTISIPQIPKLLRVLVKRRQ